MARPIEQFAAILEKLSGPTPPPKGEVITVSDTVSKAASVYEKIRNTLEYEEPHLLRRNAIRRILRRRIGSEDAINSAKLAEQLLFELIWAKYLPNGQIAAEKVQDLATIINKYFPIFKNLNPESKEFEARYNWLLDVLSSDLEYTIAPPTKGEALASYAFSIIKKHLSWVGKTLPAEDQEMQLYIAIHRALLKSNMATLRYRVLTLYYPEWEIGPSETMIADINHNLSSIMATVDGQIRHPVADSLYRFMRKKAMIFWSISDAIEARADNAFGLLNNQEAFLSEVGKVVEKRQGRFKLRLRRTVMRAVGFLLLTKMFLAIVIEVPYDLFVFGETNTLSILVNILFHPLFLLLIGTTVRVPSKKNITAVKNAVSSIVYDENWNAVYKYSVPWKGTLGVIMAAIYSITFVVSYGVIAYLLARLTFNSVSIVLFLFFFSLVSFFGIKIRGTRQEVVIIKSRGGIIGFIFDLFFLPIIRVGRWLSLRAPRVNVFIFFFDFILEAPFKLTIEMIEGWVSFMREKKEEL